jgi:predicted nucleic acid-binding protein
VSLYVVDASVAIKWLVSEVDSDIAMSLRRYQLAAPELLGPECANILWKKAHLGLITDEDASVAAAALERMPVALHSTGPLIRQATALSVALEHPAYDCFYLCLAVALDCPFITADERLLRRLERPDAESWQQRVLPLRDVAISPAPLPDPSGTGSGR